ncbi:hypothetical protein RhiirA5_378308 [Rhizophagus irregularis]|uniref:Uncharacterized protein n=1 Tax=Rhizophagus irregularis TaxID=588596 RepID=A0A2N0PG66_9GLOM|nr:hypothetical protein RhiirA5_378308 [Rhizophagus irregularis]
MEEYHEKIREKKLKNRSNENKSKSIKTHPQAIYTSRLLNFKNLPEPVNSSDLTSFQVNSVKTHPQAIYTSRLLNFKNLPEPVNSSELSSFQFRNVLDVQFSESDLNEINQEEENLNDES